MKQDEYFQTQYAAAVSRVPLEQREAAEARYIQYRAQIEEALEAAHSRLDRIGSFEQVLNLDKIWHVLHYLFTGHVDDSKAPGDALLTGEELGDDVGYGPARLHNEEETQDFGRFLDTLDEARLEERVNHREMLRIRVYGVPMGPASDAEYEAELRALVASFFPRLRDYVVRIAEKQEGLLIWVS